MMRACSAVSILLAVLALSAAAAAQTPGPPVTTGFLTASDGVRLFYRKLGGKGPFVVFLHGGPGLSMQDGGFFMDPLARDYTLIMYDQRGGGRSQLVQDPRQLTADADVRDLEALRRHFHIARMTLVGLSWGSGLAALYTAAHPDRVSRLVFLDPMPVAETPFVKERNDKIASLRDPADVRRLGELAKQAAGASDRRILELCRQESALNFQPYFAGPRQPAADKWDLCDVPPAALRNSPTVFQSVVSSLGHFDFRPVLRTLRVPALIIEGAQTSVPLDSTRAWAAGVPEGRLLLVPAAGHATFAEQPQAVIDAIRGFLAGHWPAGAQPAGNGAP